MTITVPAPAHPAPITSTIVNGGFLFREDESLKQYIQGKNVTVFDQSSPSGGRPISVYFRMSETEVRTREYPFIIIDNLGWEIDHTREQRGPYRIKATDHYAPDGTVIDNGANTSIRKRLRPVLVQAPASSDYTAQDLPIPVNVRYQVSAYARKKIQMMWIENQMTHVFPPRFGAIDMAASNFARDDNSVRCLDLLGDSPNNSLDPDGNSGKRIFGHVWTVGISSELLPSDLERALGTRVQEVIVDPSERPGYDSVSE